PAVTDVSFEVVPGETLAIIGPNGAGKSTLFGLVAGEHRTTTGRIEFQDTNVTGWPAHRRAGAGLSRTFQVARLFGSRTVEENIALAVAAKSGWYRDLVRGFDRAARSRAEHIGATIERLR